MIFIGRNIIITFWFIFSIVHFSYSSNEKTTNSTGADVDSFIVDDDKEENVKKSMLVTSGSMALGFMPKTDLSSAKFSHLNSTSGSLAHHIGPSISLEKSLKTLDLSGDKRGILPKAPVVPLKYNKTNHTNLHTMLKERNPMKLISNSTGNKSTEKHNVITNSSILGFLSKNPKFSISDVGNQKDDEVVEKNDEEKKSFKSTLRNKISNATNQSSIDKSSSGGIQNITNNEVQLSSKNSKLHLANGFDFFMPMNDNQIISADHVKQVNAVKKEVSERNIRVLTVEQFFYVIKLPFPKM